MDRPSLNLMSMTQLRDDTGTGESTISFLMQSSAEDEPNYHLNMSLSCDKGYLRISVGDIPNTSVKRYRVPEKDVLFHDLDAVQTSSWAEVIERNDSTTLRVPGLYRVEVIHKNFRIMVFNKSDKLVQILNSNNLFTFEKHRLKRGETCLNGTRIDMSCHPKIDPSGIWVERFGDFIDRKYYGPSAVGIDVELVNSDAVFGLPEHTLPFKLPLDEDFEIRFFNSDISNHPINSSTGLYGSNPMLTAIHDSGKYTSGIVWLNPSETFVTLSQARGNNSSIESTWLSETGFIDIIILTGPRPEDVLRQYHAITGKPALPPIFALGFHQSKWGYDDEDEVDTVSFDFRRNKIPVDVIWLDIQHTNGNRYMTWEPDDYGNPVWLTKELASRGQKLVAIIDPHIKLDNKYHVYKHSKRRDFFVKESLERKSIDFVGDCWPGESSYLDFTREDVRNFWAKLLKYSVYNGSSPNLHVWNDMNEPSVFDGPELTLPRSTLHLNGTVEHRAIHNIYGQYFHHATFEGLLKRNGPNDRKRPFVLSRSFFVGSHRYGPVWTGDNQASWEYLKISVAMLLSLAVTGQSFAGADVGGFHGDPSKELFIRWHQLGAMVYPFYRCHSVLESKRREPWLFDQETLDIVRTTIQMRYMMLPYWYTAFAMHALNGVPIIRPLWYEFMDDPTTFRDSLATEEELLVGRSILVRPVVNPYDIKIPVYLPGNAGELWYNFHNPSSPPVNGGVRIIVPVVLEVIPTYVRGGCILPMKLTKRLSTQFMKNDPISLRVFPDSTGTASGLLYIDDEESMGYLDSRDYTLLYLQFSNDILSIQQIEGNRYVTEIPVANIEVFGYRNTSTLECRIIELKPPFPNYQFSVV